MKMGQDREDLSALRAGRFPKRKRDCGMTEYIIEYARSGRSKCKSCRSKIEKKGIRCGVSREMSRAGNTFMMTNWYHLNCFQVPPTFVDFDDGLEELTEEDQDMVTEYCENIDNQLTGKRSKKSTPGVDVSSKTLSDKQQEDETKLQKLVDFLSNNFTGKVMQEMLRTNNQKISGVKKEKAYRCADGIMFGKLPLCPKCGGGKLRNEGARQLSCPGYRDDEDFHFCRFEFDELDPKISEDDENWVERGVWEYDNDDVEEDVKEFLENDNTIVPPPPTPFSGEEADAEDESLDEDDEVVIKKKKKKKKKKNRRKRKKIPSKKKYTDDEDEADEEDEDDFVPPLDTLVLDTPRRSTRLSRKERKSYVSTEEEVIYETPVVGRKRKRKNEDEEEYIPPVNHKKRKLD